MMKAFFASTARGLEELLKSELTELGAQDCRVAQGGVYFEASEPQMYSILLWTRLASRVFLPLTTFTLDSDEQLYHAAREVEWDTHFNVSNSFVVNVTGTNKAIRNSQYGALKVKDAIVDYFLARDNQRPDIEKQWPDIRLNLFIDRQQATLSLDLSGESLHHRGYRQSTGQAPIKENLAAAIILRSGWKSGMPLLDPLCGSGTLLIEAAFMALGMAPGLLREYWGFSHWKQYNAELWQQVLAQAKERAHQGQQSVSSLPQFFGFDYDEQVINKANMNAKRAGVSSLITFKVQEITQLTNPCSSADEKGVIVSNPPYGERLGSEPALVALYSVLGQRLKHFFSGWAVSLFSASPELLTCLQLRADKQFKAKNGPLDCIQKNYKLSDRVTDEPLLPLDISLIHTPQEQGGNALEYAPDFANRLRKNLPKYDKWAKREGVDCYRIYDADLPEYNVAIDRYGDFVVVQEYAAPKTIDPQRVRQRLFDVINATLKVLGIPSSQLILKVRERQKGKKQYQKLAQKGSNLLVHEYNAKFWVNLTDYLDTGLFLDHRLARRMIGQMSKDKDFLNLFSYTGTATIHAALGGAKSTTTVDMSYTYLEWAEKNLDLNELFGNQHRLIQADCLNWLKHCQDQFDLIFIDPPTFSNSKRMEDSFDVQRDHLFLMQDLKRILRDGGTLIFSNNKRGFKMDYDGLAEIGLSAEDITTKTISLDFARRQNIHQCWLIRHC